MSVTTKVFARLQNEVITQYSLTNQNQMAVRLLTFGARVQQLRLPEANGADPNLIVGFVTLQDYLNQPEHFGALLGRDFAHPTRTDWQNWNWAATIDGPNQVSFHLTLDQTADDTPGQQQLTVTHQLDDDNVWTSSLQVTSDTPITIRPWQNLAFMLTGDPARTIMHQQLTLGDAAPITPTATVSTATKVRLADAAWALDWTTSGLGVAVSTYEHLDTTTNFNGIQGHPHAAVGLRPLVDAQDAGVIVDAAHPYTLTTTVQLHAN
ncbi:aldose epimerase family protein [Lacticaseibacillus jixiensis]|uniref:aldose epimerase family protein n=1 Tax=Lacticaseibacillus jixiensis TaxID=3231926 RepID=UPI0036F25776